MPNPELDSHGNKWWYNSNDELHREDGPAVEYANGHNFWFIKGKLHRLDGPAVDYVDGNIEWWIDGEEVTDEEYPKAVLLYKCKQVLES
jgi:hypothetical protein